MILPLILALVTSPIHHALQSSVLITATYTDAKKNKDGYEICSGFVVGKTAYGYLVATARHCTNEVRVRHVWFYDGESASVVGVVKSKDADAALLLVDSKQSHDITPLAETVNIGTPYFLIGYSSGDPWSYASLQSRNGAYGFHALGIPFFMFDGPTVYQGDSGAAVFNSLGDAVGICFAIDSGEYRPGIVYVTPIWYVKDLLRGLK